MRKWRGNGEKMRKWRERDNGERMRNLREKWRANEEMEREKMARE